MGFTLMSILDNPNLSLPGDTHLLVVVFKIDERTKILYDFEIPIKVHK